MVRFGRTDIISSRIITLQRDERQPRSPQTSKRYITLYNFTATSKIRIRFGPAQDIQRMRDIPVVTWLKPPFTTGLYISNSKQKYKYNRSNVFAKLNVQFYVIFYPPCAYMNFMNFDEIIEYIFAKQYLLDVIFNVK